MLFLNLLLPLIKLLSSAGAEPHRGEQARRAKDDTNVTLYETVIIECFKIFIVKLDLINLKFKMLLLSGKSLVFLIIFLIQNS